MHVAEPEFFEYRVGRGVLASLRGTAMVVGNRAVFDAHALSEATVGVAMGAGTDVARESADVVLIGNDLAKFVDTVRIARNCRRIIPQNFYGTPIVDTIGIGLAAAGFLNPPASCS